jgi:dTDP-glucose 4,6-dehydratase
MSLDSRSSILLTGGTGFFGKALLRHWLRSDRAQEPQAHVTLLSRDPQRFAAQNPELVAAHWLTLVQGDICDASSLPHGIAFTHILHAAAESTLGPQLTPTQRFDQIVNGTRNMLELARACGASRFLLTSSGGVYGPQPPYLERIPEDYLGMPDPLNPANAYSVAKRVAEHLCALYRHSYGLETVVARCFAFGGRDLPLAVHFAIGNFVRDALHASAITVNGDGSPTRSYMDQSDLACWLVRLLHAGHAGEAYNVGSDQTISIRDLAYRVRDLLCPGKPVNIMRTPDASTQRNRYIPDISKARSQLGLEIGVDLNTCILGTAGLALDEAGYQP